MRVISILLTMTVFFSGKCGIHSSDLAFWIILLINYNKSSRVNLRSFQETQQNLLQNLEKKWIPRKRVLWIVNIRREKHHGCKHRKDVKGATTFEMIQEERRRKWRKLTKTFTARLWWKLKLKIEEIEFIWFALPSNFNSLHRTPLLRK